MAEFHVDPDIRVAKTLDARIYGDPEVFARMKDVFARSWLLMGNTDATSVPEMAEPRLLLPGFLDEPLVIVRDSADVLRVLSNVCTHRGALVCEGTGRCATLRCRYHGRRFGLDGVFRSMPQFEETADFPSPADDLPPTPFGTIGPWIFASLDPTVDFERVTGPMLARNGHLPFSSLTRDASRSRDYLVQANWALYCENYM
ncbi:MAG: aromatic ring-hydroxylating dioxygenase subunit alpha, partial [Phycisphaerales bacterium]|nr:aromatic ring-hydroxylating dioxygenase subunit alpha [Phycisphaerales bacterium]